MFGFIRPVKSELRVREVERFQSVYCGLCHAIRQRYGNLHTCFLSYDMTFLALLLESLSEQDSELQYKRCVASPVRKKCVLCAGEPLQYTADVSVLLTCLKIEDSIADEQGLKKTGAQVLRGMVHHGFAQAQQRLPQESETMQQCMQALAVAEAQKTASIDRAADPFARMMQACIPENGAENNRILREMLYHMGRWVYLVDACADLEEDWKSGGYNPIALRYALTEPKLDPIKEAVELTLARSLASVHAAFVLLPIRRDFALLENIICLGMPTVTRQVLDGTYQSNGGRNKHGSL